MSHLYKPENPVPKDSFVACLGFTWPYKAEHILLFKQILLHWFGSCVKGSSNLVPSVPLRK